MMHNSNLYVTARTTTSEHELTSKAALLYLDAIGG